MSKSFMGVRLRTLREERRMTQLAAARAVGLSPSYYNQLENNERPLTVPVLMKVTKAFDVGIQVFSEEEEARLVADLRDALSSAVPEASIGATELQQLASSMPDVGRAVLALHQRFREAVERADAIADRFGDGAREVASGLPPLPIEEVRDFFYARHNHVDALERAAEVLFHEAGLRPGDVCSGLEERLTAHHGVVVTRSDDASALQRQYDPKSRRLLLARRLSAGQRDRKSVV